MSARTHVSSFFLHFFFSIILGPLGLLVPPLHPYETTLTIPLTPPASTPFPTPVAGQKKGRGDTNAPH